MDENFGGSLSHRAVTLSEVEVHAVTLSEVEVHAVTLSGVEVHAVTLSEVEVRATVCEFQTYTRRSSTTLRLTTPSD